MIHNYFRKIIFCALTCYFSTIFAAESIKIASYNIRAGLDSSIESIAKAIVQLGPDVIEIQEIDESNVRNSYSQTDLLKRLAQFDYSYFCDATPYKKGQYGHAILSKYPLKDPITIKLPKRRDKEDRVMCLTRIELDNKKNILIAGAHFGLNDNTEQIQYAMNTLQSWIKQEQIILLGDFNMTPDNPIYQTLTAYYREFISPPQNMYDTYPTPVPSKRIDYILTSKEYSVCGSKLTNVFQDGIVNWDHLSDHYPLMIEIPYTSINNLAKDDNTKSSWCEIF